MIHYRLPDVLTWVADCIYLDAIPERVRRKFSALVAQANAAHEAHRRFEREVDRQMREASE